MSNASCPLAYLVRWADYSKSRYSLTQRLWVDLVARAVRHGRESVCQCPVPHGGADKGPSSIASLYSNRIQRGCDLEYHEHFAIRTKEGRISRFFNNTGWLFKMARKSNTQGVDLSLFGPKAKSKKFLQGQSRWLMQLTQLMLDQL